MKKRFFALIAFLCALVLVGCGKTQAPATQGPVTQAPATTTKAADTHNYGVWIAQVDATCDTDGTLGHYHCDHCNKDFDADHQELTSLVIPKGHKYGTLIDEVPATLGAAGVKAHYHCSACGKDFDAEYNELTSLELPVVTEMTNDFNNPNPAFQYGAWNGQNAELDGITVYELYANAANTDPTMWMKFGTVPVGTYEITVTAKREFADFDTTAYVWYGWFIGEGDKTEFTTMSIATQMNAIGDEEWGTFKFTFTIVDKPRATGLESIQIHYTCPDKDSGSVYFKNLTIKKVADPVPSEEFEDLNLTFKPDGTNDYIQYGGWNTTGVYSLILDQNNCDPTMWCKVSNLEAGKKYNFAFTLMKGPNYPDGTTPDFRYWYFKTGEANVEVKTMLTEEFALHQPGEWFTINMEVDLTPEGCTGLESFHLHTDTWVANKYSAFTSMLLIDKLVVTEKGVEEPTPMVLDFNSKTSDFEFGGWNGETLYELRADNNNCDPTMWAKNVAKMGLGIYEFTFTVLKTVNETVNTPVFKYWYFKGEGTQEVAVDLADQFAAHEVGEWFTVKVRMDLTKEGCTGLESFQIHYAPTWEANRYTGYHGSIYLRKVQIKDVTEEAQPFENLNITFNQTLTSDSIQYGGWNTTGVHALVLNQNNCDPTMWAKVSGLEAGKKYNFAITLMKGPNYPDGTTPDFRYWYFKTGEANVEVKTMLTEEFAAHAVGEWFTINVEVDLTPEGCTGLESFHIHTDTWVEGKYNAFKSMLLIDKIVVTEKGVEEPTPITVSFDSKADAWEYGGWNTEILFELRADNNNCDPTMWAKNVAHMGLGKYKLTFRVLKTVNETVNTPVFKYWLYMDAEANKEVSIDLADQFAAHEVGEWFDVVVTIDCSIAGCTGLESFQIHYAPTWEANRYTGYHGSIYIESIKIQEVTE